jgi:hypothetical protein
MIEQTLVNSPLRQCSATKLLTFLSQRTTVFCDYDYAFFHLIIHKYFYANP